MRSPSAFFKFVAKAALNVACFVVAGDFIVEVLPNMARDLWEWWGKRASQEQRRQEVEAVGQLTDAAAQGHAVEVVDEVAAGRPEAVRRALVTYLALIPP